MATSFDPNKNLSQALRLAQSPAGRQLLTLLKNTDGAALQAAMDQASAGNYDAVKDTLKDTLSNPEIQALLKQLEKQS